jgi:hypothetical protein
MNSKYLWFFNGDAALCVQIRFWKLSVQITWWKE